MFPRWIDRWMLTQKEKEFHLACNLLIFTIFILNIYIYIYIEREREKDRDICIYKTRLSQLLGRSCLSALWFWSLWTCTVSWTAAVQTVRIPGGWAQQQYIIGAGKVAFVMSSCTWGVLKCGGRQNSKQLGLNTELVKNRVFHKPTMKNPDRWWKRLIDFLDERLLKHIVGIVAPVITHIFNLCLTKNTWTRAWKIAKEKKVAVFWVKQSTYKLITNFE